MPPLAVTSRPSVGAGSGTSCTVGSSRVAAWRSMARAGRLLSDGRSSQSRLRGVTGTSVPSREGSRSGRLPTVIRNAIVHMNGEQPLLADLRTLPSASDACLVCTNLRYMNGKKPSFTDAIESWFLIPLLMVRFVEVPAAEIENSEMLALPAGDAAPKGEFVPADDFGVSEEGGMDFESESELLRRMREV